MRHQNSVFHDLLKRVPWGEFERLVGEHGADHRVRRLSTKSQFIALLYGQLSGGGQCAFDVHDPVPYRRYVMSAKRSTAFE